MKLQVASISKKFDQKIIFDQASFTFESMAFWGEMVLVRPLFSTVSLKTSNWMRGRFSC